MKRHLLGGDRLEFRPGTYGGWASRYVAADPSATMTLYNFVYFGPEIPKDAVKVSA